MSEADLGVLLARPRELLEDPGQGHLDLGAEPTPRVSGLLSAAGEAILPESSQSAGSASTQRNHAGHARDTDSRALFDALAAVVTAWGSTGSATRCSEIWSSPGWWSRLGRAAIPVGGSVQLGPQRPNAGISVAPESTAPSAQRPRGTAGP